VSFSQEKPEMSHLVDKLIGNTIHHGPQPQKPSPVQKYQNFEQLNMENLTHPSNNAKKKGRDKNNNNLGQGRNQPSRTNLLGATRTKGTRTPRGAIIIGVKGEITIMLKPTSLVPFVVILVIILIIAPKSLISNG
jgi:hypothetical protein